MNLKQLLYRSSTTVPFTILCIDKSQRVIKDPQAELKSSKTPWYFGRSTKGIGLWKGPYGGDLDIRIDIPNITQYQSNLDTVSRLHLRISVNDDFVIFEDLDSKWGSRIYHSWKDALNETNQFTEFSRNALRVHKKKPGTIRGLRLGRVVLPVALFALNRQYTHL